MSGASQVSPLSPQSQQEVQHISRGKVVCLTLVTLAVALFNIIALAQGGIPVEAVAGVSMAFLGLHAFVLLRDLSSKEKREQLFASAIAYKVVLLLLALGGIALNAYAMARPEMITPALFFANIGLFSMALGNLPCTPGKSESAEKPRPISETREQALARLEGCIRDVQFRQEEGVFEYDPRVIKHSEIVSQHHKGIFFATLPEDHIPNTPGNQAIRIMHCERVIIRIQQNMNGFVGQVKEAKKTAVFTIEPRVIKAKDLLEKLMRNLDSLQQAGITVEIVDDYNIKIIYKEPTK